MKWLWISLLVLLGLAVLLALAGALSPATHAAARRVRLPLPPAAVWSVLVDTAAMPQWRKELKSVTPLAARDGHRCWREVSGFGPIDLCAESEEPGRRLVLRIVTENSPFGGTWTFELAPDGDGTQIALTENGEIHNVVFRALARFVFGHAGTIEGWLRALAARCGAPDAAIEPTTPAPAPLPR